MDDLKESFKRRFKESDEIFLKIQDILKSKNLGVVTIVVARLLITLMVEEELSKISNYSEVEDGIDLYLSRIKGMIILTGKEMKAVAEAEENG